MDVGANSTVTANLLKFNWIEYSTFGSLLGISAMIGIYYGCIKGNQNTVSEYMLGGKTMNVLPIALSLVASHVSGITLLGVPSEVYEHGTQYLSMIFSTVLVVYGTNKFYVPVFFDLQLNSVYEYLELRFSSSVRKLASFIFLLSVIMYVPVVIYIPALAFNQVTGTSIHSITPIVCVLCIFYTTIGGLKAVVWTDAVQSAFTAVSMIAVIILGVVSVGGITRVLEISKEGERLEMFNMDPDPFARNTFWTVTLGTFFLWIANLAIHPGSIQRFIALPNMKAAKQSVIVFGIGIIVVKILSVFVGLIIYTKYSSCDPIRSKMIEKYGQLLPLYVQEVATVFPGLTGLFLSGLISAALSTMSAGLNTVAGTLYEDFIIQHMPEKASDATASLIMKVIVVIVGTICVMLVYVVEKLGGILQMAISLNGITNGAIFAVFALGIFWPWANTKGALVSMFSSLIGMGWIIGGSQWAIYKQQLQFLGKPTSVQHCVSNSTFSDFEVYGITQNMREVSDRVYADENLFPIYRISYMYYTALGSLIGITFGILVSHFTGGEDIELLRPELITPPMRRFLPQRPNFNNNNSRHNNNRSSHNSTKYEFKNERNANDDKEETFPMISTYDKKRKNQECCMTSTNGESRSVNVQAVATSPNGS